MMRFNQAEFNDLLEDIKVLKYVFITERTCHKKLLWLDKLYLSVMKLFEYLKYEHFTSIIKNSSKFSLNRLIEASYESTTIFIPYLTEKNETYDKKTKKISLQLLNIMNSFRTLLEDYWREKMEVFNSTILCDDVLFEIKKFATLVNN